MTWADRQGSRDRKAWLLLIKEGQVLSFRGSDIPGVCAVVGTDYKKDGKWSFTTYRLLLAEGVSAVPGRAGWETGRFTEGLGSAMGCKTPDTWSEVAGLLGVSVPSCMSWMRVSIPSAAERLDKVEEAIQMLETASDSADQKESITVTLSFGCPTRRQSDEGYWDAPKEIPGYKGSISKIDPEEGWYEGNIRVSGITGTVISAVHSRGRAGGYYDITLAVVPGSELPNQACPVGPVGPVGPLTPFQQGLKSLCK
jgi:hypothetical protein